MRERPAQLRSIVLRCPRRHRSRTRMGLAATPTSGSGNREMQSSCHADAWRAPSRMTHSARGSQRRSASCQSAPADAPRAQQARAGSAPPARAPASGPRPSARSRPRKWSRVRPSRNCSSTAGLTYDARATAGVLPSSAPTRRIAAAIARVASVSEVGGPCSASATAAVRLPPHVRKSFAVNPPPRCSARYSFRAAPSRCEAGLVLEAEQP